MEDINKYWRYYNHALLPNCEPHEEPNIEILKDPRIWKISKKMPYLIRWTSNYDCGYETSWWYCIKDSPLYIGSLKAKRRYEIAKGNRFFEVKVIDPRQFKDELFNVQKEAYKEYPIQYRPKINLNNFYESIDAWSKMICYGAFFKENNQLCGYALLNEFKSHVAFSVLKTIPIYEKHAINAALVYKICEIYNDKLLKGYYICNGERNIYHQTNFQDYLEKYFGFRKAYCKLKIKYHPLIIIIIKILFPFRVILKKINTRFMLKVNALLTMEYIARKDFDK